MILPIITAVSREVFLQTPRLHEEAALALGATRWEMIRIAVLPFARSGIVSAAMLGLGRALGETMAVLMILSPGFLYSFKLLEAGQQQTIAANIAAQFPEANPLGVSALIATGLALFVITLRRQHGRPRDRRAPQGLLGSQLMTATTLPEGNAELRALLHQVDQGRHRKDRLMKRPDLRRLRAGDAPADLGRLDRPGQRHRAVQRLLPHALDARGVRRHGRRRDLPRHHRHPGDHARRDASSRCPSACSPPSTWWSTAAASLARAVTFFVDVMTGHPVDRRRSVRVLAVRRDPRSGHPHGHRRRGRPERADDPGRRALLRGDAAAGPQRAARGGPGPGRAPLARRHQGRAAHLDRRHRHRHHARHRPHHRRDRAAAHHRRRHRLDQLQPVRGPDDDAPGLRLPAVLAGPGALHARRRRVHPDHQLRPGLGRGADADPHRHAAQPASAA